MNDLILSYADSRFPAYRDAALDLHANPEICNEEYHARDVLCALMEEEGFETVKNVAGHETGFTATWKSGKPGPVLVFLAEYDALAGLGHGCGHNLFGPTSCLAAAALKQAAKCGEIRVYGTPGEEGGVNGSAKGSFVREGFFKDVDAALCVHPGSHEHVLTGREIACAPVTIEFWGRASHAAASPQEGINALDALILVYNGINALRQQTTSDVRIHGIITHGGDAPNIIPAYTQAKFYIRAATVKRMMDIYHKIENIVQGAALATGCTGKMAPSQNQVENIVPTPSFDAVYLKHLLEMGEPYEEKPHISLGSSDVGNVSQVVPVIQPMIPVSDVPVPGHSIEKVAACKSEKGLASIALGAKLLAQTGLDLLEDPQLLASIKREHAEILKNEE